MIKQTQNKKMRLRILTAMREQYPALNLSDNDIVVIKGRDGVYTAWLSERVGRQHGLEN